MIPLNVPNPLKKKSIWEVRVESKIVSGGKVIQAPLAHNS